MELMDLGTGAGGGVLVTLLSWIGFSRRLEKLEAEKQTTKVCDVRHEMVDRMDKKLDYLISRLDSHINHGVE